MKDKIAARCTCVDNLWACERHNPPKNRAKEPLHFSSPGIGNLCGVGGRTEKNLRDFLKIAHCDLATVCPTCALRATALEAQQRDQRKSRDEIKVALDASGKWDVVSKPAHYNAGKVECIDALEAATVTLTGIEAVCTANAIKYLWRWKQKNGAEDLRKAKWYIDRLLKTLEGGK